MGEYIHDWFQQHLNIHYISLLKEILLEIMY